MTNQTCCSQTVTTPCCGNNTGFNTSFVLILVLFILLVIIGAYWAF